METKDLHTIKEIYEYMLKYDKQLRSDKHFISEVTIKHLDESYFNLPNTHYQEDDIRLYIYTEHCGFFFFVKEDLEEARIKTYSYNKEKDEDTLIEDKIIKNSGE